MSNEPLLSNVGNFRNVDLNLSSDEIPYSPTPLHKASGDGNLEEVKELIESGEYVDSIYAPMYGNFCWTPLSKAAIGGHLNVVKYLIEKGADINIIKCNREKDKPNMSFSPLSAAAMGQHLDTFNYLIDKGAKVDNSTLYQAVEGLFRGKPDKRDSSINIIKQIMKNKNVNPKTNVIGFHDTQSSLDLAKDKGDKELIKLLTRGWFGGSYKRKNKHNTRRNRKSKNKVSLKRARY